MDRDTGAVQPWSVGDGVQTVGPTLEREEAPLELWTSVRVRRADAGVATDWTLGQLYLTDRRLIHVDGKTLSVSLADITELTLAGPRLLVSVRQGGGFVVEHAAASDIRSAIAAQMKAAQNPSR